MADAASTFAKHTDAVGFVNHHGCVVFLGQLYDLLDVSYVAFH